MPLSLSLTTHTQTDLYEPSASNRRSNFVVVLGVREDVCCIVGKAALGEMLSNVECVVAHDYFFLLGVSMYSSVDRFGQGFGLWLKSRRKCFRMFALRDTGPLCLDINSPVHKI